MRRHLWPLLCLALLAAAPPPQEPPLPPAPRSLRLGKTDRMISWHDQGICGVGFSPDGKAVATAGGDNCVRLRDAASGKLLRTFRSHLGFLRLSTFSPDGRLVAWAGNGKEILLWDPATGREVRRLVGHTSDLYTAIFTPDGKTLVSAGFDAHVRVWDVASGKQLQAWRTHQRVVYALALSPDGTTLATGGDIDSHVRLWHFPSGRVLRSWSVGQGIGSVAAVAYSPDGAWLASAGPGGLCFWDVASGKEIRRIAQSHAPTRVVVSADGRLVFVAGHKATVMVYEVLSGKEVLRLGDHGGHGWVWGLALAKGEQWLISGGHDGAAVLWDLRGRLRPLPGNPVALTNAEREALWADLAGDDAGKAYRAIFGLAGDPASVVPMLRKHLLPGGAPALDAALVARLVEGLDSEVFTEREKASADLDRLGPQAVPMLKKALVRPASLEVKRRLERLVAKHDRQGISGDELRLLRAVHVLEECAIGEAGELLKAVVAKANKERLSSEAQAALTRLAKRASAQSATPAPR